MMPALKISHLLWSHLGPKVLLRYRRSLPRSISRDPAWFHDYPTLGIAMMAFFDASSQPILRLQRVRFSSTVGFLGAGILVHAVSVRLLARRWPRYEFLKLTRMRIPFVFIVAVSEEIIWGSSSDVSYPVVVRNALGFGLTHRHLGGWPATVHMGMIGLLARIAERRGGLACSALFHFGYNVAYCMDIGRRTT